MILLNIPAEAAESFTNTLLQYGVLGAVSIILGAIAYTQYKRLLERNDTLEAKVDRLQAEMNELLVSDRDRMSQLVEENTKAIEDLRSVIITTLLSNRSAVN